MQLSSKKRAAFQNLILEWWADNRRELPWRNTRDPYHILVAEVMLQQTQVSRVVPKYAAFLTAFPTVYTLAEAAPAHVLRQWQGMGYNRRALYLQRTAQAIVGMGGTFPRDEKSLRELPGLGKYTTRAIMVFAYELEVSVVDTNVRRIIRHYFYDGADVPESAIEAVADQLVPPGNSWAWHQALMDYGALELPKLAVRERTGAKQSIPFRETSRFYRGRVVDALREKAVAEHILVRDFARTYGKPEAYLTGILDGLARDGLLFRDTNGIISLPK